MLVTTEDDITLQLKAIKTINLSPCSTLHPHSLGGTTRNVQNRFFNFGLVSVQYFEKKLRLYLEKVRFGLNKRSLVQIL